MTQNNGWKVYEGFNDWRVQLYQHIREIHPDALEALLGDMKQAQARIEAMQVEVQARAKMKRYDATGGGQ